MTKAVETHQRQLDKRHYDPRARRLTSFTGRCGFVGSLANGFFTSDKTKVTCNRCRKILKLKPLT